MPTKRMRRVNEVMREVIGSAIATELEDPRIGFVTVTSVEISPDLRSARVHVSVLGDETERASTLAGLRSSHGVLQATIAREMRIHAMVDDHVGSEVAQIKAGRGADARNALAA